MTTQAAQFDLSELAAEAAQQEDTEQAAAAAHGPFNHQDAIYGCHGSHGSRSVR